MPKLTPKQERFVSEYLQDLNATQAAIRAGYSPKTAQEQSSRLLSNAIVADEVAKSQAKAAKRAEISIHSLADELEEARAIAVSEKQSSAAVAATMGKAKLFGFLVERKHHSGHIGTYDLSKVTDEQLSDLETILGSITDDSGDQSGEGEA